MPTRDIGVAALGRFLAVERYCQAHEPFTTQARQSSGPDRRDGHAGQPDRTGRSQPPARRQHG